MTINVPLNQLVNLQNETTAVTQINQNSNTITSAFSSALNTTGDKMLGTLDMNSNQVINLPTPATANSPVRLQDLSTVVSGGTVSNIPSGGVSGQVLTKSGTTPFVSIWANAGSTPNVGAGTGLTFSGTTFSITNTGTATGTFGAAASVPVLTVNAQGQITSITTVAGAAGGSASAGTFGSAGTSVQIVVSSSGQVTSVTSVAIAIAGSQVTSGTVSGSVVAPVLLSSNNANGGVTGSLPFTNMVGTDIAAVGTVTTGTWSATAITATSLSGSTLAGGVLVSSVTTVGTITTLSTASLTTINTVSTPFILFSNTTTLPTSLPAGLHLASVGANGIFVQGNLGYAGGGTFAFYRANGSATGPTTLTSANAIGNLGYGGYNGSGWVSNVGLIQGVATDATGWTATTNGFALTINTTPTGTTVRSQAMRVGSGLFVGTGTTDPGSGNIQAGNAFIMPQYTVTALPAGVTGMVVMVTDASASTFLGSITGGGTTKTLALYSGATWLDI